MSDKQEWRPNLVGILPPLAVHAIGLLYDAIGDHDNAINVLHGQVKKASATSTATTSPTATVTTTGAVTVAKPVTSGRVATSPTGQLSANSSGTAATASSYAIGAFITGINNQGSAVSYSVQDSDYNGLVIFNSNAAITVTLNSAVATNFTCMVQNLGTAQVTLQPSTGTVNGAASLILQVAASSGVFFDGQSWWALTSPQSIVPRNTPAIAHEWINSYDATTGIFTQSRPDVSDVTGAAPIASPTFTGTVTQPTPEVLTAATLTTSATAGTASALPGLPSKYLTVSVNGTNYKIPLFLV